MTIRLDGVDNCWIVVESDIISIMISIADVAFLELLKQLIKAANEINDVLTHQLDLVEK